MEDHRLGDLLRELPRERARPGFTARLLSRLEAPERRRALPRLALAGALTTLAITAGVLVDARRDAREALQARQALQEIRAEHGRLEREVRELSRPPVMYLGGNENVDLVLDLGQVGGTEGAKPAAYHDETF
jgi:type II secretory pathway component PulM